MDYSFIVTVLVSILVVFVAHYGYQYLRDNLTTPTTKDVVGFQSKKMDEILQELKEIKEGGHANMEDELLEFAQTEAETQSIL